MKHILLFILLTWSFQLSSQEQQGQSNDERKEPFIRVYDANGKKIGKGNFSSITDSTLIFTSNQKLKAVLIEDIKSIKTKRSFGHLPLVLGTSGLVLGGIVGAASDQASSSSSGSGWALAPDYGIGFSIVGGSMVFGPGLALVGVLISASKKYETFEIDGDVNRLKSVINTIENEN